MYFVVAACLISVEFNVCLISQLLYLNQSDSVYCNFVMSDEIRLPLWYYRDLFYVDSWSLMYRRRRCCAVALDRVKTCYQSLIQIFDARKNNGLLLLLVVIQSFLVACLINTSVK